MLYDIAFFIFSIFYLPVLIFKGKLHKEFAERFGIFSPDKRKALEDARGAIWIQAVSVGEVAVCKSLVAKLRAEFPDRKVVISTITKTGNDLAKKLFSQDAAIIYFPLDFSVIVRKVAALIKPSIYIMIETEIWPNLLKEMADNNIPSILINGRISDRSFGKYILAKPFLKKTFSRIGRFSMQSEIDAERIISMGAPKDRVKITGNMKYDIDINIDKRSLESLIQALSLKADEELVVAGSTHPGEENIILEAFKELRIEFPKLRLLIAPRHIERASEAVAVVNRMGFRPIKLSDFFLNPKPYTLHPVFILDKIGYLNSAYSLATVVFIGGSLIKHGGQNPIEPAVFEKAILFGPHMFNFKDISRSFLDSNGAVQVSNKEELIKGARRLLNDKNIRDELGRNAKKTVMVGRGATEKNLSLITEILK